MTSRKPTFQPRRDLEHRLIRRRAIEAAIRAGRWKNARHNSILLCNYIAVLILRVVLQATGIYLRGGSNALDLIVRHLQCEFENLPANFGGYRILHLSDLHIDRMDGLAGIIAQHAAALDADLCVMTGDYRFAFSGPCDEIYPRIQAILSSVRAPDGVAAVLGNHDESDMAVQLENLGVRMLINEAVEITRGNESLWIVGVDDPHRGCDELDDALEAVPTGAMKVLLAHSPEIFDTAAAAGIDLYLCGHTHSGQIRLPWIGAPLLNASCPRSYSEGQWQHKAMLGYTSAGAGCSLLPVRYNCAPEIALIELLRK